MAIKQRSSRKFGFSIDDNGDYLEIGPGGTAQTGGVLAIQFIPDGSFVGSVIIMGKVMGTAAREANVQFMPVMYRPITINNVATDFSVPTAAAVTGPSTINVPSNGVSVALFVECTAGTCQVVSWNLQGAFQG